VQITQGNTLQALRGVQAFLDKYAGLLPGLNESGARKKLDALVEELGAHAAAQTGSVLAAKGATQKQYAMRIVLLEDYMAPIARIAEADLPDTPELRALRLPQARLSTENLAKAAVGMADAAEPHAAVFIAAGLAPDFVAQLRQKAKDALAPLDLRTENRSARRGATRGVKESIRAAKRTVRVLDTFVRRMLRNNAVLMERWAAVKRPNPKVGRVAGQSSDVPAPPPEPAAPLAPAAPTSPLAPTATAESVAPVTLVDDERDLRKAA
jgi:hypothetical protein